VSNVEKLSRDEIRRRIGLAPAPHGSPARAPDEGAGDSAIWPEPDMRLVEDACVPAPTLDNDALPAGWEDWVSSEAAARACPPDYVAASLIGAASGFIGNARRIAATADWNEPAHLWFANIGVPSAGKTPALRPMIDASRRLERDAEPAWREAVAQYERDAEAASARDKAWPPCRYPVPGRCSKRSKCSKRVGGCHF
jgi:hypothetical protein